MDIASSEKYHFGEEALARMVKSRYTIGGDINKEHIETGFKTKEVRYKFFKYLVLSKSIAEII